MTNRRRRQQGIVLVVLLAILLISCMGKPENGATAADSALSFSPELSPYPAHPTAKSRTTEEIYARTATPGITLSAEYVAKRKEIIRLYQDAGVDLSLEKEELRKLRPTRWAQTSPQPLSGSYRQPYSIDAPFYHKIPANWPRVALPAGYVQSGHISTIGPAGDGSDGFGIGVVIAKPTDPVRQLSLANGAYAKTGVCPAHNNFKGYNTTSRIPDRANVLLGGSGEGVPYKSSDRTVVWLDSAENTTVATWITSPDCDRPDLGTKLGNWSGEAVTPKEKLPNLGDQGGINAAAKADLVTLIRPGEATDREKPIPHALSGPVQHAWRAIVYPANNVDNTIEQNNRGLLGYGFLVQLDPQLKLETLNLSLPARRILEAIQTYGWYMDDTGVRHFDIKGNFSAAEFAPFGGFDAVDAQVLAVLKSQKLYVVPPLIKK